MAKNATSIIRIKSYPQNKKLGRVFNAKNRPEDEINCAEILRRFGFDIYFQKESKISGVHTADILWKMDGVLWEIKTLYGNSYDNTVHAVAHAKAQSQYIILNARKTKRRLNRIAIDVNNYLKKLRR